MRRLVMFAAVLAAVAIAPQPGEAGDRGFGFRHFSPHPAAGLHLPRHGFKHHHGQFFGKHRHLEPRHGGLVLKFSDGDFFLRFGSAPHFQVAPLWPWIRPSGGVL